MRISVAQLIQLHQSEEREIGAAAAAVRSGHIAIGSGSRSGTRMQPHTHIRSAHTNLSVKNVTLTGEIRVLLCWFFVFLFFDSFILVFTAINSKTGFRLPPVMQCGDARVCVCARLREAV